MKPPTRFLFCALAIGIGAVPISLLPRTFAGEECAAPNEWFGPSGTPEADYTKDLDPNDDCDFYRFAWQTFLFVTQPAKGETTPRLLNFATLDDVFGEPARKIFPQGKKGMLTLTPRIIKPRNPEDLDGIFQALSGGAVVDQRGRAVYYGLHMNNTFVSFVRKNNLTTAAGIDAAPADLQFEPGCLEFKSSWRVVAKGEDTSNVFTTMAILPTLVTKDNRVIVDPTQPRQELVALVGLHVVGVAKGHPEFIWATFEHVTNSPDLPIDMANIPLPAVAITDDDWTFCPKGTLANKCNLNNGINSSHPLALTDPANQTLTPKTPVFRHFAFGGDDPRGVVTLNGSVHEKLPKQLTLWKNYELIGAVWIDNPADVFKEDQDFPDEVLAGATKLSNSTMETFTQNTARNCFSCHRTKEESVPGTTFTLKPKRINVSHMLVRAYALGRQAESVARRK
jgi:hypothetical protein